MSGHVFHPGPRGAARDHGRRRNQWVADLRGTVRQRGRTRACIMLDVGVHDASTAAGVQGRVHPEERQVRHPERPQASGGADRSRWPGLPGCGLRVRVRAAVHNPLAVPVLMPPLSVAILCLRCYQCYCQSNRFLHGPLRRHRDRRRPRRRRSRRPRRSARRPNPPADPESRDHRPDVVQSRDRRDCQGHRRARGRCARRGHGPSHRPGPDSVPDAEPVQGSCSLVSPGTVRSRTLSSGGSHRSLERQPNLEFAQGTVAEFLISR